MKAFALWTFVPLLFAGCATTCPERDIYRPRIVSAGDGTVEVSQTEVVTDIASLSLIRVGECGWAKRDAILRPVALCMTIQVEDSHVFQLLPSTIRITSPKGRTHEVEIAKLRYTVFSLYKSDGSEQPDSSVSPPTSANLEVRRGERYGNGRTDLFLFDAGAPFVGATSKFGPPMARALSQDERRRRYVGTVSLPLDMEKQFVVQLPKVSLDGRQYSLAQIEFRYSREPVCSFSP